MVVLNQIYLLQKPMIRLHRPLSKTLGHLHLVTDVMQTLIVGILEALDKEREREDKRVPEGISMRLYASRYVFVYSSEAHDD